jgi:hypothetical protein
LLACLLGGLLLPAPAPVQAATFTVTSGDDSGGDSGTDTLREAIAAANANPDADTIVFDGVSTVTLTSGQLEITQDLTIDGGDGVIIERDSNASDFRIFVISGSETEVTLDSLTIQGGSPTGTFPDNAGGGIYNSGTLTVTDSEISENTADEDGGGIFNAGLIDGGTVIVNNSEIIRNVAGDRGGGIYSVSGSTVEVRNSELRDNTATAGGGGGIFSFSDSILTVTDNSIISGNEAGGFGGGILNDGGTATVSDSTISGNTADGDGGGLRNRGGGTLEVTNSEISDNDAGDDGGGIASAGVNSMVTVTGNEISGNSATEDGGGIFNEDSTLTVENSTLSGNSAARGGGIWSNGKLEVTNSTLSGNSATDGGGGMFNFSDASFLNARIVGNEADDGGGIFNNDSSPTLVNVLIAGNRANATTTPDDDGGGGMFNSNSSPTLVNVTIAGNYSDDDGGGIFNVNNSNPSVTNSIIWGNECDDDGCQVEDLLGSTPTYDFSLVENEALGSTNLDGTSAANDPQFVEPIVVDASGDNTPNTDGDYHLQQVSPLIDASIEFAALGSVTTDLDNTPRFVGSPGTVDLGPYELQCPTDPANRVYVDASATGANNGISWSQAMPTVQDALALSDRCPNVNEIWVADGTYYPDDGGVELPGDRRAAFELRDGLFIYGGFAGGETNLTDRDPAANPAILSGDITQNDSQQPLVTDIDTVTGTDDNSYHVVYAEGVTSSTLLDGFTITAGNANGTLADPLDDGTGGGVFLTSAEPRFRNLVIQGNQASVQGGGMSNQDNSPPTETPELTDVAFIGNGGSTALGGGLYNLGPIEITNARFVGNQSQSAGGGLANGNGGAATLTNVVFTGNQSVNGGGLSNGDGGNATLTNVTIAGNYALDNGGGVFNQNDSDPAFINSIVWGNAAGMDGDQVFNGDADSQPTYSFSLVQGASLGGDNLSGDTAPAFVNPVAPTVDNTPNRDGDYRLQGSSGVIDQGDNNAVPSGVTTDVAGNQRIIDGDNDGTDIVDPGAYEYIPDADNGDTCGAQSTFDSNNDGWTVSPAGAGTIQYQATGGNPGGQLEGEDTGNDVWYYQAPARFLGDQICALGGTLHFDLRHPTTNDPYDDDADVVLEGGGVTLTYNAAENPGADWTTYRVSLTAAAGWINAATGQPATQQEIQDVLSALTALRIRGEYSNLVSGDISGLDNVILTVGSSSPDTVYLPLVQR